ncbi:MAG: sigma-54-dependent Fis family transcriptional regulator, partial [Candidatus Competibacteraceae bacterium]|nr:sigma-54-dependent Fis family transcriptional regulator [Candidatus Competibacteraceae bacterium]
MGFKILIVDDEHELCTSLSEILIEEGYETLFATDPRDTIPLLERERVDLIIMDIRMPAIGGVDLLRTVKASNPDMKVIILTGHPHGAERGPDHEVRGPELLREAAEPEASSIRDQGIRRPAARGLEVRLRALPHRHRRPAHEEDPPLRREGGVDVGARAHHRRERDGQGAHRQSRAHVKPPGRVPFFKINSAAIPEPLLESELFGHEKGAFTNAVSRRKGKFELADRGTIFLDEIGDMNLSTQAKILRVLQEMEFERVGGSETIRTDLRLITATNKDLGELIKSGRFREDLYYRICVVSIHLPPLRERKGDVPLLISHFISCFNRQYGKSVRGLEPGTAALLLNHV